MLIPLQKKSHTCYSENCFIKSTSIAKTKKNLAHDLYVAQMVLSNEKENELGFFFFFFFEEKNLLRN